MNVGVLKERLGRLRMPLPILEKRSGVPRLSLVEVFSRRDDSPAEDDACRAVMLALGGDVPVPAVLEAQAVLQAHLVVRNVQGLMALECQAVPESHLERQVERCVREFLAGPAERLWGR